MDKLVVLISILYTTILVSQAIPLSNTQGSGSSNEGGEKDEVELTNYESVHNVDGNYRFQYSLTDGTEREEDGEFVEKDGKKVLTVTGSYTWIDELGNKWLVTFTADDNGNYVEVELLPSVSLPAGVIGSLLG